MHFYIQKSLDSIYVNFFFQAAGLASCIQGEVLVSGSNMEELDMASELVGVRVRIEKIMELFNCMKFH